MVRSLKTDIYSVVGNYGINIVSKKGKLKDIKELPQKFDFAAEKDGWLYGFSLWEDAYFYKAKVDEFLYGTGGNGSPFQKISETEKDKHGSFTLTDK